MKCIITPAVIVNFEGDPLKARWNKDDHGVCARFLKWQMDNNVFPIRSIGGMGGGGCDIHAFHAADAEQIAAWFKEQGVNVEIEVAGTVTPG